jgi:hypothetical protein
MQTGRTLAASIIAGRFNPFVWNVIPIVVDVACCAGVALYPGSALAVSSTVFLGRTQTAFGSAGPGKKCVLGPAPCYFAKHIALAAWDNTTSLYRWI